MPAPVTVGSVSELVGNQRSAVLWALVVPVTVTGDGIGTVTAQQQAGGWRVFVSVDGAYRISVS